MRRRLALAAVLLAAALGACGDDDTPERPAERADAPAKPPPGGAPWRTRRPGSRSPPQRRGRGHEAGATLIRSKDELVAVTIAADRSTAGRDTEPGPYAGKVVAALPGFQGDVSVTDSKVAGSPYETAIAVGSGTVKTSGVPQRIEVVVFRRPRQVTYSAVIFRNARAQPVPGRRTVARMLSRFRRGRRPIKTPCRRFLQFRVPVRAWPGARTGPRRGDRCVGARPRMWLGRRGREQA